jgi:type IV pilus assembly protein PilZ
LAASGGGIRSGILNVSLNNAEELYKCYMPFLVKGGIFIPTTKQFSMGDDVFVLLELMGEAEKFPLTGKIVWISPAGGSNYRKQGVGIEFPEDVSSTLINKIETQLAGLLSSEKPTYTL